MKFFNLFYSILITRDFQCLFPQLLHFFAQKFRQTCQEHRIYTNRTVSWQSFKCFDIRYINYHFIISVRIPENIIHLLFFLRKSLFVGNCSQSSFLVSSNGTIRSQITFPSCSSSTVACPTTKIFSSSFKSGCISHNLLGIQ